MAGASPLRSCEATIHEIAQQVKPDGGLRRALVDHGFLKKLRMAPCRASIRLPFPTDSGKLCAPRHGQHAGHCVARGELTRLMCGVQQIPDELFSGFCPTLPIRTPR
jgi:hypothetical protein